MTASSKKLRNTGRSDKVARHMRIYHWFYDTPAWQNLQPIDRCIYLELLRRYNGPGTNNGRIPLSVREVADLLKIGKSTAARAFDRLQEHGFVAVEIRGRFARRDRHATEWRLTEHPCDVTGELPTKEFTRWKKIDGPTLGADRTYSGTLGTCSGTEDRRNDPDGICSGTVAREKAA